MTCPRSCSCKVAIQESNLALINSRGPPLSTMSGPAQVMERKDRFSQRAWKKGVKNARWHGLKTRTSPLGSTSQGPGDQWGGGSEGGTGESSR